MTNDSINELYYVYSVDFTQVLDLCFLLRKNETFKSQKYIHYHQQTIQTIFFVLLSSKESFFFFKFREQHNSIFLFLPNKYWKVSSYPNIYLVIIIYICEGMKLKNGKSIQPLETIERMGQIDREVEKMSQGEQKKLVGFFQMFRFADKTDFFLMILGTGASIVAGGLVPAYALAWGKMIDAFSEQQNLVENVRTVLFLYLYLGAGSIISGWLMYALWMISGARQATTCKKKYLQALISQEIGWFDTNNQSELASNFAIQTSAYQNGVGEKIGALIAPFSSVASGVIIAFLTGWRMSLLVFFVVLPALGLSGGFFIYVISNYYHKQRESYVDAGQAAQNAITSIKTVKQLNGQDHESLGYKQKLKKMEDVILKASLKGGLGFGLVFFAFISSMALGFWYGSKCVMGSSECPEENNYTAGDVVIIFNALFRAGFTLIQVGPCLEKIIQGRQAAYEIFSIIDREPLIKSAENPLKLQKLKGVIKFHGVSFAYPKNKSKIILDNITLQFNLKKTALVGHSGCGKSTILQLIMRYYDPDKGSITLDGHDLRKLDLEWLRENIGYVQQEPFLFAGTIKENLEFGKANLTEEEILEALKYSNAFNFVSAFEKGIDTFVGEGGSQLSGGQKQRIGIARVLLRKPEILILDEATSALDNKNEVLVQESLDVIPNMKTINVAHRATSIMNSDKIFVMEKGKVAEEGSFFELEFFSKFQFTAKDLKQSKLQRQSYFKKYSKKTLEENDFDIEIEKKSEPKQEEKQSKASQYQGSIYCRLFTFTQQKKCSFAIGFLLSILNGGVYPVIGLFISKMFYVLIELENEPNNAQYGERANFNSLIVFLVAVGALILYGCIISIFRFIGYTFTSNIRLKVFEKILKMPIPWFDKPENSPGSLIHKLSADCFEVQSLLTIFIQLLVQNTSTLITGMIIALIYDWRVALVGLFFVPLIISSNLILMKLQKNENFDKNDEAFNLLLESMINIRTILSCSKEQLTKKYNQMIKQPQREMFKTGITSGLLYGFGKFFYALSFGLLPYIGVLFIMQFDGDLESMLIAVYTIAYASFSIGDTSAFIPDIAKGAESAGRLFQLLDDEDEYQAEEKLNTEKSKSSLRGDIVFKNVRFQFPNRKEKLYENLNFTIKNGEKVVFVGSSGCGKSTIMYLLLRFYDATEGQIYINGLNIKQYDLSHLRRSFAIVGQQPALFFGSIEDNIRYNLDNLTKEQVRNAAQQACATFALQHNNAEVNQTQRANHSGKQIRQGFDRNVGVKGLNISGGEKQRIAIARAIVRKPEILLLDEATSALDPQTSTKVVQNLEDIMNGRTMISVVHNFKNLKTSDRIIVLEKGSVIEEGTYQELLEKKGGFYQLKLGLEN